MIGSTTSQTLDLTLINRGDIIYSTNQIKVEIGLKIESTIEYILMGYYNIDDVEKTDYTIKFTAYDNMIKFETPYFSSLGDTATLQQVVNELASKTGVQFTGSLPAYNVKKLEGFTCRETLSYVASLCGGNAVITRDGKFTIVYPKDINYSITGDNYVLNNFKREEVKYKIGKISCQVKEKEIISKGSLGTDSMELLFENPWVSETILTDIYNRLNGFEYLGYSMKWQGDISLDVGDIITCTDVKGVVRKLPILSQKFNYTGGLTAEIGAKGESKNKNTFSSNGNTANKVNRVVAELLLVNKALIDKANIKDLEAVSIKTQTLEAKTAQIENAIINVAHIEDLNVINANIQSLIASDAAINQALINKADIAQLNTISGKVNVLESDTGSIKNLLAGNVSAGSTQTIHLTSQNVTIDSAVIKDLIAANISVQDLKAGNIDTNRFNIVGPSGNLLIKDNTIQIKDANRTRVQIGKDASNDYNMYVWDSTGKLMFDATGLKADGIKSKIIRDDMVSDTANISGSKINISSLISEFNKDTNTQLIKASKVAIDLTGQSLEVSFNSLKSNVDDTKSKTESNTTSINTINGQISALIKDTTIEENGTTVKLKDSYSSLKQTVDGINTTVASHTSSIGTLNSNLNTVSTKVTTVENKQATLEQNLEGFKTTVSNTYSTKTELNTTNSNVSSLSSRVNTAESSITQLNNKIALKVESSDITTAINNIQVGGRNLLKNSALASKSTAGFITFELTDGFTIGTNNYVVSFTYTCTESNPIGLSLGNSSSYDGSHRKTVTLPAGTDVYISYALTDWTRDNDTHFTFYTNKKITIKNIKVEKGNKSTDWTPAPEDVDQSIASVDNKVSTLNTTVSTVSNKVATIETSLTSITQRVSSTESSISTHTTQIGQVDGKISTAKTEAINTASTDATTKANNAKSGAVADAKSYTDTQITTVNTTINNKVAEIKTTTDSITSRVSSTESSITTINTNVSSLTTKVNTVEQSITATALTTTISSAINAGTSSISTTQFVMDKTGLTIKNGALTIQNKAGTNVLTSDTNGNLTISGTFINRNWNNVKAIQIDNTTITFFDWERSERELGYIYSSFLSSAPNCRGFSLAHHNEGYMTLGYRRPDGTYGSYIVLDKFSKNPTYQSAIAILESAIFEQTVKFKERVYIPQALYLGVDGGSTVPRIYGASNKLVMQVSVSNKDDGLQIQSNTGGILAYILAGNSYPTYFNTHTYVNGNLAATGTKARLVNTQNYGGVKLNAVESADAVFEDIGEGIIDEVGLCYIYLDPVMQETINAKCSYQVFLQKYGEGDLFVLERNENYFVVKGTSNLRFGWRFAAKQKGYETERLEQEKINITEEYLNNIEHDKEVNYEDLAYSYLEDYEKELISVEY